MVAVAEVRVRLRRGRHTTGLLTQACRHTCRRAYPGVGTLRRQEKSHAPRGAAASVNADARGSATIFASQASRGSQGTRGAVFLCALRPHMPIKMNAGVQHAEFQEGRKIKRGATCATRCLASVGRRDVYFGFFASVVELLNFWTTRSCWRVPLIS